jgi:MOSC domain-containing protein YiiM
MSAIVKSINISDKKGVVKKPIAQAVFVEDFGMQGDAHGGKGKRQVSLLAQESIDKMKATSGMRGKGLCEGKFAENITTEGLQLYTLAIGTKLKIGDTIQQVSQIGKECHSGCEIMKQVGQCIMPREGIFTMVIKGGIVKAGDKIEIIEE